MGVWYPGRVILPVSITATRTVLDRAWYLNKSTLLSSLLSSQVRSRRNGQILAMKCISKKMLERRNHNAYMQAERDIMTKVTETATEQ